MSVVLGRLYTYTAVLSAYPACKESRVRQPGASGFCYRASDFVFNLPDGQALFLGKFKLQ